MENAIQPQRYRISKDKIKSHITEIKVYAEQLKDLKKQARKDKIEKELSECKYAEAVMAF
jgi:hypothetical protein